jgi:WD40-like Beta Propeller Repeat
MNRVCRTTSIAVVVLLTVSLIVSSISAAPKFSEWSAPINLGPIINSMFDEAGPAISKDGLSLYFLSNRPGGVGNSDIWLSCRDRVEDSWGVPVNLGPTVNSTFNEVVPNLSRDGHYLFFTSDRPGGSGNLDLWVSFREHTHEDFGEFGWQEPVNLGSIVNTAAIDGGPSYFENDDTAVPQLFLQQSARWTWGLGHLRERAEPRWVIRRSRDGHRTQYRTGRPSTGNQARRARDVHHVGPQGHEGTLGPVGFDTADRV